jgi:hypothetical protein
MPEPIEPVVDLQVNRLCRIFGAGRMRRFLDAVCGLNGSVRAEQ